MRRWFAPTFLFALLLLIAVEAVMRVAFARSFSGRFEYGYHPTAGFVEKTGGEVNLIRAGGRKFWPQTFPAQPAPGTLRIMVFGDSVPRGPKLNLTYGALLHEKLKNLGVTNEVINFSVAGNGSARTQIILREALRYNPGLVILHVNNSNEYEDEREWNRYREFLSWHPKNWLMKSILFRRVYEAKTEQVYWKLLDDNIRSQREVNDIQAKIVAGMNEAKFTEWNERVRTNTLMSAQLARQHGARVVLIAQARWEKGADGKKSIRDGGLDEIVRAASTHPDEFVSMKEVFATTDNSALFADGAHLKAEGHQWFAEVLAGRVRVLLHSRSQGP